MDPLSPSILRAPSTLWRLLSDPAELFACQDGEQSAGEALRFRWVTAMVAPAAVLVMLVSQAGLGDQTAAGLAHLGGLEIVLAALTLVGLPLLGIAATFGLGIVAHAVLPASSGGRSSTLTVVMLAFGVRAFSVLPGFELPTLAVAIGLSVYGLWLRRGVSFPRAVLAVLLGGLAAAVILGAGVALVMALELGLEA